MWILFICLVYCSSGLVAQAETSDLVVAKVALDGVTVEITKKRVDAYLAAHPAMSVESCLQIGRAHV